MSYKLIVGLNNPGEEYAKTRHNVGAWLVERLVDAPFIKEKKFFGRVARHQETWFLLPDTYMNKSGLAISAMATFYRIQPEEILIAHDELDLEAGQIRLKKGGGHAGHNGLRSAIDGLGNQKDFGRIRIGIGHPGHKDRVTPYVLGRPSALDQQKIEDAFATLVADWQQVVADNWEPVMKDLHAKKV